MSTDENKVDWLDMHPSPVTICDTEGIIVAMNRASRNHFSSRGGGSLVGTSLFDCHPKPANVKIRAMLSSRQADTYIVDRKGRKRLIHQEPWYKGDKFAGLIETIIDIAGGDIEERKRS